MRRAFATGARHGREAGTGCCEDAHAGPLAADVASRVGIAVVAGGVVGLGQAGRALAVPARARHMALGKRRAHHVVLLAQIDALADACSRARVKVGQWVAIAAAGALLEQRVAADAAEAGAGRAALGRLGTGHIVADAKVHARADALNARVKV